MIQLLTKLADTAPDEFIDPITLMIMQQPMKVPTSPYVLDRRTLVSHLAINPSDPFSRKPLTMDMIYPDVALKIRCEAL
jgi:ubiquitin conjugation factor E4 B